LKIGMDADITPLDPGYNGLTFYDRGPDGTVMGCHNATGAAFAGIGGGWPSARSGNAETSPCSTRTGTFVSLAGPGTTPQMPIAIQWGTGLGARTFDIEGYGNSETILPIPLGGVMGVPRADGYAYGLATIQGVRAFDSAAGIWTTPDAYAGDVHDPASQKSYMWNGNNPVGYTDPSGYDPTVTTSSDGQTVNIQFKVVFNNEDGVSEMDELTFLSNLNFSQSIGDITYNVSAEAVGSGDAGKEGTTTVHLEDSSSYADRLGGAPANGAVGNGNHKQYDGNVWDVRVGTDYGSADHTAYAQMHEMLHNAGVVHAEDAPDVMAVYMSGEKASMSERDAFQILVHAGIIN
jgi:hypothetical protein